MLPPLPRSHVCRQLPSVPPASFPALLHLTLCPRSLTPACGGSGRWGEPQTPGGVVVAVQLLSVSNSDPSDGTTSGFPALLQILGFAQERVRCVDDAIHPSHSPLAPFLLLPSVLKLRLQSFGHLTQRADSLEKTLMLGKVEEVVRRLRFWCHCLWSLPAVYQRLLVSLKPHSCKVVLSTLPSMALGSGNSLHITHWVCPQPEDIPVLYPHTVRVVWAETPILWPPDVKNWLTGKDPDAGKDWRQEENGMTEDEMVGWHHRLNGHSLGKLRELVMDREAWHLQSMGLQRVRHDWVTELNWTESSCYSKDQISPTLQTDKTQLPIAYRDKKEHPSTEVC